MSVKRAAVQAKWIIGRVIGTKMVKTAKVRVTRLTLDPYLLKRDRRGGTWDSTVIHNDDVKGISQINALQENEKAYYNKRKTYFGHDALQQCTVGDIVLLKALPEPRSKHVKHELAEIVYKVGRVVDPLTGKRVAGAEFVDPLMDLPQSLQEETTLSEKLKELDISAASSGSETLTTSQTATS